MTTANGRNEFAPPPTPGFLRALGLAILAHGLLVAMLTVGVQWKREATPITVEAELWSAVPEQAAPPAPEPATQTEPIPVPPEPPVPVAPPPPVAPVAPPPPVPTPDADIAVAKEKARLKKEKLLLEEKREEEKQLKQRQDKLQREKLEREKEKLEREQEKLDKAARDKKLQAKREQDAKADKAADTAKLKAAAKAKEEEAKKLEELRQQNMKRMAGLAGGVSGNGDARSTGTAAQASGPSAGYGGRIQARIKPNITYTEQINGNPTAKVEVRTSPDGTIISRKLTQSSGVKSWDDAVLAAIDKTEVLPRDTDGRVPPSLEISFRPKD
jgi:colicin import membrane protein